MKGQDFAVSSKGQTYTENLERAQLTNLAISLGKQPTSQPQNHRQAASLADAYLEAARPPEARKLFIRSIAEGVSDSVIESLLLECGPINYFRRSRNERGEPVSFGTVEFQEVEGLLNCVRLLQRFALLGKKIEVSMGEKAKGLISEYISFRKAEVGTQLAGKNIPESEIDQIIADELSARDAELQSKLRRIAQTFEENKDKILKTSEKTGALAITEEKLNVYKQKFGVMNNKELNERFYRDLEKWLESEKRFEEKRREEENLARDLHRWKMRLIEDEVNAREEDFLQKAKVQEKSSRSKKQRRIKILKRDIEFLKENLTTIEVPFNFSETDGQLKKRPERLLSKEEIPRESDEKRGKLFKRAKQEIIQMQPAKKENNAQDLSNLPNNSKSNFDNRQINPQEISGQIKLAPIELKISANEQNLAKLNDKMPVTTLGTIKDHLEEHKPTFAEALDPLSADDAENEELLKLYSQKHKPITKISESKLKEFERQQKLENKTREELEQALLMFAKKGKSPNRTHEVRVAERPTKDENNA